MLGAVIGQHGIRKLAFQKLGSPLLPSQKETIERIESMTFRVTTNHRRADRRGSRDGVEHNYLGFSPGEKLIHDRQIANDHCDEAKPGTRFEHSKRFAPSNVRHDISISQREERDSTEVNLIKPRMRTELGRIQRPEKASKRTDKSDCPDNQKQDERKRTVEPQKVMASIFRRNFAPYRRPDKPGSFKKVANDSRFALHASRKEHDFKGVVQDGRNKTDTKKRDGQINQHCIVQKGILRPATPSSSLVDSL